MEGVEVCEAELELLIREAKRAVDLDDLVNRLETSGKFYSGSEDRRLGIVKRVNFAVRNSADSDKVREVYRLIHPMLDGEYGYLHELLVHPHSI
ncbi:hypothetical protein SAMN02745181_3461 [Rubritalea squalenifaciens DSM 18772]|uniref:Uncharacterized protein n=2 Tax=Rubritalea squalenifaciens TaxID=407226 RepID=A0A1M6QPE9_9BACT|nr:hypothetical protein SAMN02745181_3461 [Rubritalea squalenifaciens DSM 18772]